ncbi:MAG: peptidoglycan DD-metalloendopeptidase family protein [Smithellaceae bacterium]|nr:peptidoglycan DD-metalloendopeptidase family protein [Smithellaceae bacterium]
MIGKKTGCTLLIVSLLGIFAALYFFLSEPAGRPGQATHEPSSFTSIAGAIAPGETLYSVFQKHALNLDDLFAMKQAAASVHRLKEVYPGQPYRFTVDAGNVVRSFTYGINENTFLAIERGPKGFQARKYEIPYESRVLTVGGDISDSLVAALGSEQEDIALAVAVSEILAWDIDFSTDLRQGDSFKVIVEGLYLQGKFRKYGKILAVEFLNDNNKHVAYRFEQDGRADYFDAGGKSLRKAFLKAPLSFRRISSSFSRSRRHPILKVRRPHHGIDYVAPQGTPVSATADGRISFAGRRGGYGKLVVLAHRGGLETYYGHLSRFAAGIRAGRSVRQGDLVGYVGATGLASGPHLHYEVRREARPINPVRFKMAAGDPVPPRSMAAFRQTVAHLDRTLASAVFYETQDAKSRGMAGALALKADPLSFLN